METTMRVVRYLLRLETGRIVWTKPRKKDQNY